MSSFDVLVRRIAIEPHPNADRLEIGKIDGYNVVVGKGLYNDGDLVVYIPDQAVLPDELIDRMEVRQYLSGAAKNRVKPAKLRGVLSEGLTAPVPEGAVEGDDVAELLGITKYDPGIPVSMAGKWEKPRGIDNGFLRTFTDVENLKKFNASFTEGEPILAEEKIHGTCTICSISPDEEGNPVFSVTSKGIAARHLTLAEEDGNVYWRAARKYNIREKMLAYMVEHNLPRLTIYGETFGPGVQDLTYGVPVGEIEFLAFDVYNQEGPTGYMNVLEGLAALFEMGIPTAPVLYTGPYNLELVASLASGKSVVDGKTIREGVVIRPIEEREDRHGRACLKYISDEYLTRKEGTEYN